MSTTSLKPIAPFPPDGGRATNPPHAKRQGSGNGSGGFTLVELFVVTLVVGIVWILVSPMFVRPKNWPNKLTCVNNVKQMALGFCMWSNDNDDRFPWLVSTNANTTNGPGTLELVSLMDPTVHFQAVSNDLVSLKTLVCLTDPNRSVAINWSQLSRTNISYFINLDANDTNSNGILLGDRNLVINKKPGVTGLNIATTNDALAWDGQMHNQCGNIALVDGSVQQFNFTNLNRQLQSSGIATNRFVIP